MTKNSKMIPTNTFAPLDVVKRMVPIYPKELASVTAGQSTLMIWTPRSIQAAAELCQKFGKN